MIVFILFYLDTTNRLKTEIDCVPMKYSCSALPIIDAVRELLMIHFPFLTNTDWEAAFVIDPYSPHIVSSFSVSLKDIL